jgi:hypothetical protein
VTSKAVGGFADTNTSGGSGRALYAAQIFQQVEASGFFMGLEDIFYQK